ncbi:hypothetical protein OG196_31925 [Kitasatospora purpeofusca]|uniref:hypothetical protein n=1 Tax=Kitasatospora purpeofusca TaxID=67352 RepID=UPI002E102717|nr:hypothetical protein OG196_31925 [Kitasatospora purpeofusca]
MTSHDPAAEVPPSPWFRTRPALAAVPPSATAAASMSAPAAGVHPPDSGTPIYDSLVVAFGDPFSRLGPTRARMPHTGASGPTR